MNVGDRVSWEVEDWVRDYPGGDPPHKVIRTKHGRVISPSEDVVAISVEGGGGGKVIFKKRSEIICLGPCTW